jgi:hypothetical protein
LSTATPARYSEGRQISVSIKLAKSYAMSTVRRQGPQHNLSPSTPKYSLAALIQRLAAAILHHLFQQAPDGLYPAR